MERSFQKWVGQAIAFTVFTAVVFLLLQWFKMDIGDLTLWVSGIAIYWVLSGITILPWNIYLAAMDTIQEMRETEEKGGQVNERDHEYALMAKKRSGICAVALHLFTAVVFFGLAVFTDLGTICYIASAAALSLTFLRPFIRNVEHTVARLGNIRHKVKFPRDDVYEIKRRLQMIESYDETAKDMKKSFEEKVKELEASYQQKYDSLQESMERGSKKAYDIEQLILHIEKNISAKIDTFDDAVAFKAAWERVAPELAKIFGAYRK